MQLHAQGGGGALAGVVIGRGANAAAGKHHVGAGERVAQRGRDALPVVPHTVRPGQRQPTGGQQLDDFGQVLVSPFAGEDFVSDDDETERRWHGGF